MTKKSNITAEGVVRGRDRPSAQTLKVWRDAGIKDVTFSPTPAARDLGDQLNPGGKKPKSK